MGNDYRHILKMISNKKELIRCIDAELLNAGFKKNGTIWYLESSECFSILELDKSTWGGAFSLGITVIMKFFDTSSVPRSNTGEINMWSLDWLVEDREKFNKYLNLEYDEINSFEREEFIREALQKHAIPFLELIGTVEGLKKALYINKRLRYHTSGRLWDYLKMEIDKSPPIS